MKLTPDQCKTQEDVNAAYEARNADILARHLSGESPRSIAARYEILHTSIVAILKKMGQKFVRAEQQSDDEKELRERVRRATYVLIKKGELARQACEVCGDLIVECHHERYDEKNPGKWIRWLCQIHHVERHNELGWRRSPPIDSTAIANAEPEESCP